MYPCYSSLLYTCADIGPIVIMELLWAFALRSESPGLVFVFKLLDLLGDLEQVSFFNFIFLIWQMTLYLLHGIVVLIKLGYLCKVESTVSDTQ